MLVLSRTPGEAIRIGDDIRVVFLGYDRGQARIGIEALSDVRILREELVNQSPKQKGEKDGNSNA